MKSSFNSEEEIRELIRRVDELEKVLEQEIARVTKYLTDLQRNISNVEKSTARSIQALDAKTAQNSSGLKTLGDITKSIRQIGY